MLQNENESYVVNTTIYTGVVSNPNTDSKTDYNYTKINNAFDNIISLSQSKILLERISLRILSGILVNGDINKDNLYISKDHFKALIEELPAEILTLINPTSEDSTYQNLFEFKNSSNTNYLYKALNGDNAYISYNFITSNLSSRHINNSDMIDITYTTDDPGITTHTLVLLDKLLIEEYYNLKMKPTKDIINYFENKIIETKKEFEKKQDDLQNFFKKENIINFENQTSIFTSRDFAIKKELDDANIIYESSKNMIKDLESKMKYQTQIMMKNRIFLNSLDNISTLSKEIATLTFVEDKSKDQLFMLKSLEDSLNNEQLTIKKLTTNISNIKYTKEGLSKEKFIESWLNESINFIKAKSDIEVLSKLKEEMNSEYQRLAPLGPLLDRKNREIEILGTSYQSMQDHLLSAKYNQKNIEMINANLNVVTNAEFPTSPEPNKKGFVLIIIYFASLFFVLVICAIIEMLDRTLRDKHKAKLFTDKPIICSFPGKIDFRYRRYSMEIRRIASNYLCNKIVKNNVSSKPYVINLISQNKNEDKELLAKMIKFNFEEQNYSVKIYNFEFNFEDHLNFFSSVNFDNLLKEQENKADIVIIINIPIFFQSLNTDFVKHSDVNLYVVNSYRSWKNNDNQNFEDIEKNTKEDNTYVILTNAKLTAVEDFTNQLPPKTFFRSLTYRLLQMEIMSEIHTNE